MKKYFKPLMLAVLMAVSVPLFTACGSDDEEEKTEQGVAVGSHRIDVSFSGDTQGWDVGLTFLATAYYANGTPFPGMYENGKELETSYAGTWKSYEMRDYSVSTGSNCQSLLLTLAISKSYSESATGTITVHVRSYVDNKLKKEKTYSMSPADGTEKQITFFSVMEDVDSERIF